MAIIQTAAASSGSAVVDPTFQAIRTSERPPEVLGAYQISMSNIAAPLTTIAAAGVIFAFRWAPSVTTNLCMIRRVEITAATTVAFGTAQSIGYFMTIARNFTAVYNAGTGATAASFVVTNTGKMRSSMPTSQVSQVAGNIFLAGSTVISGSTPTLDSQPINYVYGSSTGLGTSLPATPLYQHQAGDYPLILSNQEGFIISNAILMGVTGQVVVGISVEWMELSATSGNVISY